MRLGIKLYLVLMDGEEHTIKDYIPYLKYGMDPAVAVRSFLRRQGRNKADKNKPLKEQQELGSLAAIRDVIQKSILRGDLSATESILWENSKIKLTEQGKKALLYGGKGSATLTMVFREMSKLYLSGLVNISVDFSKIGTDTNGTRSIYQDIEKEVDEEFEDLPEVDEKEIEGALLKEPEPFLEK